MPTHLSRRALLRSVLGAGTAGLLVACTSGPPPSTPEPAAPAEDPLRALAAAARSDAAAAASAAAGAPERAAVLGAVSAERTAHAEVLDAEVARAAGRVDGTPVTAAPTTTAATAAPSTLGEVVATLTASGSAAGSTAVGAAPYRAGLLGSVAASCAAAVAVLT